MTLLQISEPTEIKEENRAQELIIGIDLGTTNSLVGIVENGEVKILSDENSRNIIPSVVEINGCEISSIKRLMGKAFKDAKQEEFSFKIIEEEGVLKLLIGEKKFRPEEISAQILIKLKNIAQNYLKKPITKAVITVPAYFDEAAKNATKLAAKLADLEVVRLVNEPTAAALAYGLDEKVEGTYLVYDLGGGTFDVSLLKMQGGVFKVLGVAGDNHLGGDDFDLILSKKLNIDLKKARRIKESFASGLDLPELSNKEFENLIAEKINKTISLTANLLEDLEVESFEVKGVILVGGSSRINLISQKLGEIFGSEKILTNLDPDRIVAIGAARQAHNLSGANENLLLDVAPLSLGVEMMGGIVDKIIYRNSTIPIAKAKEFTTYADNQTAMSLHIVQGERELAQNCRSLARFTINKIPPMKAGMARVLVTFRLDSDGLLTVSAEERITEQKQEIEIKPSYHLGEAEIKKMLFDSLENSKQDIEARLLIESINEASQDAKIIEKDLKNYQGEDAKLIAEKLKILQEEIVKKQSREAILASQKDLAKVSENLVLQKVNLVLNEKIAGKKVDEIN
jgi:molecular chaperone HscA